MPINPAKAIKINGIDCYDVSTKESVGRLGSQAERVIRCAWAQRFNVAIFLAGGATSVNGIVSPGPPQPYPDAGWMYCHQVEIDPVAGKTGLSVGANGLVAFDYAELKCTYRPFEFEQGIEQGEESLDFGQDSQVLSQAQPCFKWGDNNVNLDILGQPNVRFSIVHFSKTINNQPSIPIANIMNGTDCMNSRAFLGAAVKKLLFRGARSFRRFAVGGSPNWSISYAFSYRSIEWDKHYRPGGSQGAAGWATVKYTNGDALYGSYDFTLLGING